MSAPRSSEAASRYPAHREAEVVLRDGSTVHLRPVRTDDAERVHAFLTRLSTASRALRFFSAGSDLAAAAQWASEVDYVDRFGIVAVRGPERSVVGHAGYVRTGEARAEAAFEVADVLQGLGMGTLLLAHLAEAAADAGIEVFELVMLPRNRAMAAVLNDSGFPTTVRSEPGQVHVEIPTSPSPHARARFEDRDRLAAAAALRSVLHPRSVAVVGASDDRESIGGSILQNVVAAGFPGPVHPVNRHARTVQSLPAYPSVRELPEPVELAVVAVPASSVRAVAEDCAAAGVRALVVVSAGFAELGGEEGRRRQEELLETCRAAGMRLVGPNCLGVLSTDPAVPLDATFAPRRPEPGGVGFFSQSGGLGLAIVDRARDLGLGLSAFVSVGNKADISANDLLQHWESDERTDVIVLYLESFGNAHRFARIAGRVARSKPIVAVKSGRSRAGARATGSHTGALVAASDVSLDALFRQAGVIRVDTLAELFDVTSLLSAQPAPGGRRVAIVTNAGGPAILCADACEAAGLDVVDLPSELRERLAAFLPAEAATANPVDMVAGAGAEEFRRAVRAMAESGAVDAIIAVFIPVFGSRAEEEVATALAGVAAELGGVPTVCSVFMSDGAGPRILREARPAVPAYPFPEEAARAVARASEYGVWREAPEGTAPVFDDVRRAEAGAIIAAALAGGDGWLDPGAVDALVRAYGLPLVESQSAASAAAAARLAAAQERPVVLKAVAAGLEHKSDAGGVELGLTSAAAVERAARRMRARVADAGHEIEGFLVQPMVAGGIEMLVGVVQDEVFGPVVACGAGGTATEVLGDVAVRITPLTDRDARAMVRSLAAYRLLRGFRGSPTGDVAALEEIVLRVGAMVDAHPEIAELDLNPVVVQARGATILDARVRVAARRRAPAWPSIDRET